MESNTNINNQTESNQNDLIQEIDVEAAEASEAAEAFEQPRGRGRGWGGKRGQRPFGPNRPYRFAIFVEEDGSYVLRSPDLKEHSAKVESLDEVGATVRAAIDERAAEDAAAAAEAAKDAEYSGKFVLRLPKSMHRQLAELAESEGVSLNQLALAYLAEGMGKAEITRDFGKHRGGRHGGRGPEGHGPGGSGRGGRGGHGPEGPGGRGPWGRGPEGFGPEGRDFEGRGPRGFGRGAWGEGPWGRGGRRGGFTGEQPAAPAPEPTSGESFV